MAGRRDRELGSAGTDRRRFGELEAEVLAALWASSSAMTAADVQEAIAGELAYTTVMTILVRLGEKGSVERTKVGRAYAYRPVVAESDVVADQVRRLLDQGQDRSAVLQGLIDGLDPDEERMLRRLLDQASGGGPS